MAEYIDIDAQVVVTDTRGCEHETTVRHIFEMNKGVYTAADVVEVVRCKDCIHASMTFNGTCKYCAVWFQDEAMYLDGDYYCAYGERKTDG